MVLVQRLFPIELFNLKRSYAREVIRYVAKFGGNLLFANQSFRYVQD